MEVHKSGFSLLGLPKPNSRVGGEGGWVVRVSVGGALEARKRVSTGEIDNIK